MGNQGRKAVSLTITIILKVGQAIKIKNFGGNKMFVHLTNKVFFSNNNNHYILQLAHRPTPRNMLM